LCIGTADTASCRQSQVFRQTPSTQPLGDAQGKPSALTT
jgi:hypothetical protein